MPSGSPKLVFAAGASVVLLPQFDARRYVEAIGRFKVTWLTSVPTMLALAVRERETLARTDLSSVEFVRTGSAPITQSLIDEVRQRISERGVGHWATARRKRGPLMFGPRPGVAKPDLALGWPLPGVEVRLVGPDGEETDEGELVDPHAGQHARLPQPARKTQEVLTADGWYKSGDVFRRDAAGAYTFVGRTDDMFVCGGENIYPGEVESMLERHADIVQACVVPVPDEIKGDKPFAFVVLRPGARLTEDEVKRYALDNAPAYQHPRGVVFIDGAAACQHQQGRSQGARQIARERWSPSGALESRRDTP